MVQGPVLVTGATGFVGGHLVPYFRRQGCEVVPASQTGSGEAVRLDLRDQASIDAAIRSVRPVAVVNLAAIADPGQAQADPLLAYDVNLLGQLRLIRALLRDAPEARLVVLGSALEYGPEDSAEPVGEDAPLRPDSVYATTKAAADLQAQQYHLSDGLDVVRLRMFSLIGPGRSEAYFPGRQVRRLAEILELGAEPVLPTFSLKGAIDYVDVRDAAAAIAAATARGVGGAAYNVATGLATPLHEVVQRLIGLAGCEVRLVEQPGVPAGRRSSVIAGDPSRIRRDTGWRPDYSLDDSLRDALAEARAALRAADRSGG